MINIIEKAKIKTEDITFQLNDRTFISRFPTDFADAVGFRVARSAGKNY